MTMPLQYPTADDLRKALGIKPISWDTLSRMSRPDTDPWVKVGTTTIDGTYEDVARAFGFTVHGLDALLWGAIESGQEVSVRGRSIIPRNWEHDDEAGCVHCDIVRRQSEIDEEADEQYRQRIRSHSRGS